MWERHIDWLLSARAPTGAGDGACNGGTCPWPESNLRPFSPQTGTLTTKPNWLGQVQMFLHQCVSCWPKHYAVHDCSSIQFDKCVKLEPSPQWGHNTFPSLSRIVSPFTTGPGDHWSDFYHYSFAFSRMSYNEITEYVPLCALLLLLNMFLKFIHIVY